MKVKGNTVAGSDAATDLEREILAESEDSAYTYLAHSWLNSAIEKLWDARRQAGLTQVELAQRLGTKQPAIARLEKDDEGRISLRRYVEYALACGMLPLDITLKPASALRDYALNDPTAPRTESTYEAWHNDVLTYGNVVAPTTVSAHHLLPHSYVDRSSLVGYLFDTLHGNLKKSLDIDVKVQTTAEKQVPAKEQLQTSYEPAQSLEVAAA